MKISAVMQRALCWLFARVYSRWLISQRTMTPLFWGARMMTDEQIRTIWREMRPEQGGWQLVPVGEVVIGPSPIDGSEGFTMVRWAKERGCPPVGTRLYAEKLHPANP